MNQSSTTEKSTKKTIEKQPKGWVRWSGLLVFLAVMGGIIALSYIGYTLILKNKIESYATDIWGAKIEIGSLDIGIFPIRVGLLNVAITDPDKPMENIVQFTKLGASLNFYQLVVGRTVIEELAMKEFAFHQPREESGKTVFDDENKFSTNGAKKESKLDMVKSALPSLDEILAREQLETFIVAKKVEHQINELSSDWNNLEKNLPSQKELIAYKDEFKKLITEEIKDLDDLQNRKKALESLQKRVKNNIQSLENSKKLFEEKLPILKNDLLRLKKLPAQDLARLQDKYQLNGQGISNISYLLFGNKIQGYVDQAQFWYAKAKPFIEQYQAESALEEQSKQKRARGVEVAFHEYDPEPDFIIKKLVISSSIPWGELAANITNINFEQPTSKMPIKFIADLQPKGQTGILNITGESNFIEKNNGYSVANISMDNYQIKDWQLSDSKEFPVLMKKAVNQVNGKITLLENEKISGKINLIYQKVDFDLSANQSKEVKRYITPIFEDINRFSVTTNIKGKIFAPDLGIKSDLDRKLSRGFNKVLNKEINIEKTKLTKEFKARVKEKTAPLEAKLSKLLGDQVSVNSAFKSLDDILSKDVDQYIEEQKQRLKKKVEDKFEAEKEKQRKKAEEKLDQEKKKQQAKIKAKLKKEKQKQMDKLKDKLKNLF